MLGVVALAIIVRLFFSKHRTFAAIFWGGAYGALLSSLSTSVGGVNTPRAQTIVVTAFLTLILTFALSAVVSSVRDARRRIVPDAAELETAPRPRFSLRSLLLLTAFYAVYLAALRMSGLSDAAQVTWSLVPAGITFAQFLFPEQSAFASLAASTAIAVNGAYFSSHWHQDDPAMYTGLVLSPLIGLVGGSIVPGLLHLARRLDSPTQVKELDVPDPQLPSDP